MNNTPVSTASAYRSGFVALAGRPNVGKSTLVNRVVGQKISIVTRKPQTTRHRIHGIHTRPDGQIVFIDAPGIHQSGGRAINREMNRAALAALDEADLVLFVVDAERWTPEDQAVVERLRHHPHPVGLVVNKVDRIKPKQKLLPLLDSLSRKMDFAFVVPLSAQRGDNIDALEREILAHLPTGEPLFPEEYVTDRSERFLVGELIREQLMLHLHQEIPYALTVEVESFKRSDKGVDIGAVIWVERDSQKGMVIGAQGQSLKRIGRAARLAIAENLGESVHLELWVKVKENWTNNPGALEAFGYDGT